MSSKCNIHTAWVAGFELSRCQSSLSYVPGWEEVQVHNVRVRNCLQTCFGFEFYICTRKFLSEWRHNFICILQPNPWYVGLSHHGRTIIFLIVLYGCETWVWTGMIWLGIGQDLPKTHISVSYRSNMPVIVHFFVFPFSSFKNSSFSGIQWLLFGEKRMKNLLRISDLKSKKDIYSVAPDFFLFSFPDLLL